jgi:hypothetical protein
MGEAAEKVYAALTDAGVDVLLMDLAEDPHKGFRRLCCQADTPLYPFVERVGIPTDTTHWIDPVF